MRKPKVEFVEYISMTEGDNYTLITPYVKAKQEVVIKHNVCGESYKVTPDSFKSGRRCPNCFGKKLLTQEEVIATVETYLGNDYIVKSKYINSKSPIEIFHKTCNSSYFPTLNNIKSGKRCYNCYGPKQKTHEEFQIEFSALMGKDFELLTPYIKATTKVSYLHYKCNEITTTTPNSILSKGVRCNFCSQENKTKNQTKTQEQFLKDLPLSVKKNYIILTKYEGANKPIKLLCKACNEPFTNSPSHLYKGQGCVNCAGLKKVDTIEFKDRVKALTGDEYIVLGEIISMRKKIHMKHIICGRDIYPYADNFLKGSRCPYCNQSKGEKSIESELKKYTNLNFVYVTQAKLPGLKHKRSLVFDFLIYSNNHLLAAIEYDGIQHSQPTERYGGAEGFKIIKERDNLKNDYCIRNNITLLRIDYKQYDLIPNIIESFLYSLKIV